MLLEFPDMFGTQAAIDHSFTVLDQGIERAKQLQSNQPQWNQGKKQIHAYYSEIDGAVLPYGVTLPENYDPAKPTRLYVWLHGRQNNTTEAEFIYGFLRPRQPGQSAGGRSGTDPARLLRPHQWRRLALGRRNGRLRVHRRREEALQHRRQAHHPARLLAGWRRRLAHLAALSGSLRRRRNRRRHRLAHAPSGLVCCRTNSPRCASGRTSPSGRSTSTICRSPGMMARTIPANSNPRFAPARNWRRKASRPKAIRITCAPRARRACGWFPRTPATAPARWSASVSTLFLKEWGDKGQSSPDHIRFLTYTTRYNRDYWVSVDGLEKHYERAEVDAQRTSGGASYDIKTKNLTRLVLRETEHAREIKIDGQSLKVKSGSRDHARPQRLGVESGQERPGAGPAQDACPARPHRRRVPRSVPVGPPHRHALERRSESAGASHAGPFRPHVGQILPRPSFRQGRQGRDRSRLRQIPRRAVRRSRQQQMDREAERQTSREVDPGNGRDWRPKLIPPRKAFRP